MSYGQSYKIIVMLLANGIKVFSEDDIDTLESEVIDGCLRIRIREFVIRFSTHTLNNTTYTYCLTY